ncbi:cytochrome P450 17A2 isoform X2 [Stigmatopora argus]
MSLFCWPLISVPLVLAVLAILVAATRRSGGMPGLPRLPVVGSLPWLGGHMPPHLLFTQLGARYGPLFDIYLGPHRTVVVNDHVHAREVLLQRGRDFAGRPSMATTDLLTRDGKDIAFADYSPLWKLHRRLVHASFALFGEGSNRLQEMGEKMEPVFFFHPDRHGSGTRRFFFSSVRGGRPLRRAPVRGRPRRGPVAGGDGGRDQRGLHAGVRLRLQTRGRGAGRGVALQRRYRAHHHPGRTGGHLPLDEGFPQRVNERAESLRRRARPPPGAKAAGTQGLLAEPSRASRSPGRFAERSKFTRARRRAHHGRPRVDDGGGSLRCRRGDHVHHAPLDPGLLAPSPRGSGARADGAGRGGGRSSGAGGGPRAAPVSGRRHQRGDADPAGQPGLDPARCHDRQQRRPSRRPPRDSGAGQHVGHPSRPLALGPPGPVHAGSLPGRAGSPGDAVLLPAVRGGASHLRGRIASQDGALSFPVHHAPANELCAPARGPAPRPARTPGGGPAAATLQNGRDAESRLGRGPPCLRWETETRSINDSLDAGLVYLARLNAQKHTFEITRTKNCLLNALSRHKQEVATMTVVRLISPAHPQSNLHGGFPFPVSASKLIQSFRVFGLG